MIRVGAHLDLFVVEAWHLQQSQWRTSKLQVDFVIRVGAHLDMTRTMMRMWW